MLSYLKKNCVLLCALAANFSFLSANTIDQDTYKKQIESITYNQAIALIELTDKTLWSCMIMQSNDYFLLEQDFFPGCEVVLETDVEVTDNDEFLFIYQLNNGTSTLNVCMTKEAQKTLTNFVTRIEKFPVAEANLPVPEVNLCEDSDEDEDTEKSEYYYYVYLTDGSSWQALTDCGEIEDWKVGDCIIVTNSFSDKGWDLININATCKGIEVYRDWPDSLGFAYTDMRFVEGVTPLQ